MIGRRTTYAGVFNDWALFSFVPVMVLWLFFENTFVPMYLVLAWGIFIIALLLNTFLKGQQLKQRQKDLELFATEKQFDLNTPPTKTKLFSDATPDREGRMALSFGRGDWRYGDYKQTIYRSTKYGDYKAVEVYHSILELDLPRKLPNMLFDSPQANGLQYMKLIDENQRTSLEGDFDQYFVTYFPKYYQIDARSIISPEVMAAMIDSGISDIEIHGDKLYLYSPLIEEDRIESFIGDGKNIRKKLVDHVTAYRDERLVDVTNRQEVAVFGESLRRKKPSIFSYLAFVPFPVIFAYFWWIGDNHGIESIILLLVVCLMPAVGAYVIYRERKAITRRNNQLDTLHRKMFGE